MAAPGREEGEVGEERGDASGPAGDCGWRVAADTSGRTDCLVHLELVEQPLENNMLPFFFCFSTKQWNWLKVSKVVSAVKQTQIHRSLCQYLKLNPLFFLSVHNGAVVCIYIYILQAVTMLHRHFACIWFCETFLSTHCLKNNFYFDHKQIRRQNQIQFCSKGIFSLEAQYVRLSAIWWSSSRLHTVLMLIPV